MFFSKSIILMLFAGILFVGNASADTRLYTGNMKIVETSGRACGSIASKSYPMSLLLKRNASGDVTGFFEAEGITLGKFSGNSANGVAVTYPYFDQERSSGHTMIMHENGLSLSVTLHDRHLGDGVDECNFDKAEMMLKSTSNSRFESKIMVLSNRYDAQLIRSEAIHASRRGQLYEAVTLYEKALKLIDQVFPVGSTQRDSFTAALAGSYMKSDMADEFNKLYDQRFSLLKDEATKAIFNEYRVRSLIRAARTAMNRDDFETAIAGYRQAFVLHPQDKVVIAGLMSAYMRSARYEDAIAFLGQAEKGLQSKEDQSDVRGATAMALLKQSVKLDQSGKTVDAELALKRAMVYDPESVLYSVALARLRHKNGSIEAAEKILKQAEVHFKDSASQVVIGTGRDKMRQIDAILKKINGAGS